MKSPICTGFLPARKIICLSVHRPELTLREISREAEQQRKLSLSKYHVPTQSCEIIFIEMKIKFQYFEIKSHLKYI